MPTIQPLSQLPVRRRIQLLSAHRHSGRDYQSGQFLELPEDKADWLIAMGAAQAVPTPAPAPAPNAKPTKE